MQQDAATLRQFYYRMRLGRVAQHAIREEIAALWSEGDLKGQTLAGYGFAVPLLRPYLGAVRRAIALMPHGQGAMHWPPEGENISVLCAPIAWPLATGSVDRMVVMHGLEASDTPGRLLDEIWRVLGPGGRAIFVIPNRTGMWARSEATPFGHGRPYSMGQFESLLSAHRFEVQRHAGTLYAPPTDRRGWRKLAMYWEGLARRAPFGLAAGVLVVEVAKRVSAPVRPGLTAAVRRGVGALGEIATPAPKPVSGRAGRRKRPLRDPV